MRVNDITLKKEVVFFLRVDKINLEGHSRPEEKGTTIKGRPGKQEEIPDPIRKGKPYKEETSW